MLTKEQQDLLNLCLLRAVLPAGHNNLKPNIIEDLAAVGIDLAMEEYVWGANITNEDELVRQILEKGADVTSKEGKEATLYLVKRREFSKQFSLIFEKFSSEQKKFLHAALDGDLSTVEQEAKNFTNLQNIALQIAVEKGDSEITSCLTKNIDGEDLKRVFLRASELGHENLVRLCLQKGVNINAVDAEGNTALHLAVQCNKVEIVEYLLEEGANVNIVNNAGYQPISEAISGGSSQIIKVLLDKNPEISNQTIDRFKRINGGSSGYDEANLLVLKSGIIPLNANERNRLFFKVVRSGQEKVMEFLLDSGVDVNLLDGNGRPAIYDAAFCCKQNLVKILINRGAIVDDDILNSIISGNEIWIEYKGADLKSELSQVIGMVLKSDIDFAAQDPAIRNKIISLMDRETATLLAASAPEATANLVMNGFVTSSGESLNQVRISKLKDLHAVLRENIGIKEADVVMYDLTRNHRRTKDLSNYFIELSARHTTDFSDAMHEWIMHYPELSKTQHYQVYKIFSDFFIPPQTRQIFVDKQVERMERFLMAKEDRKVEMKDYTVKDEVVKSDADQRSDLEYSAVVENVFHEKESDILNLDSSGIELVFGSENNKEVLESSREDPVHLVDVLEVEVPAKKKSPLDIREVIRESREEQKGGIVDFGRSTPSFSVYGNEVLTRATKAFNTPARGVTRPSKIQHDDSKQPTSSNTR